MLFAKQLLQFSSVNYNLSMYTLSQLKQEKEKQFIKNLNFKNHEFHFYLILNPHAYHTFKMYMHIFSFVVTILITN